MSGTAFLFIGPSLPPAARPAHPGLVYLPPVAQGDVAAAARERPVAIGIVDGYFEGVPAVWHKEILHALKLGIHVVGGGSMGALRAAELHPFGMEGRGRIFEAFRDGVLTEDDEVAVVHGPPETGYAALSEPMINIRATLEWAVADGVIDGVLQERLTALAKATFYPARSFPGLLEAAAAAGLDARDCARVAHWLDHGRVDRKGEDALTVIRRVAGLAADPPAAFDARFHFEWTERWDDALAASGRRPALLADKAASAEAILDELRLAAAACPRAGGPSPGGIADTFRLALLRLLADRETRASGGDPRPPDQAGSRFRAERGLFTRAALERWLAANDLRAADLPRLIAEEAALERLALDLGDALAPKLLDQLRLDGRYPALRDRAAAKQAMLERIGQGDTDRRSGGPNPAALRAWFVERCRQQGGEALPEDAEPLARRLGFADRERLDRALRREYLYLAADED
jgi:hypothetical protein